MFGLHESAVHQHIQQCQQLVGRLAPRGAGFFAGKLFPSVAGVAPHRLGGVQRLEVAHKGQQLPLVLRLKGFAAQQGEPGDIVRLAGGKYLVAHGLIKGLTVGKVPCYGVEAARAVVAAAGHKNAGAHPGAVGDIVILDVCVVHSFISSWLALSVKTLRFCQLPQSGSLWQYGKLCRFAKVSPFGRGGTAGDGEGEDAFLYAKITDAARGP